VREEFCRSASPMIFAPSSPMPLPVRRAQVRVAVVAVGGQGRTSEFELSEGGVLAQRLSDGLRSIVSDAVFCAWRVGRSCFYGQDGLARRS
jgi:hypothetical protein